MNVWRKNLSARSRYICAWRKAYKEALNITEQLFAGNIKNLSVKELKQGLRGVPNYQVKANDNLNIVELLVTAGVVNSKRQAREDVQNGAIYVNAIAFKTLTIH